MYGSFETPAQVTMPAPRVANTCNGPAAAKLAADHGWAIFPAKIEGAQKKSHKSAKYSGGANWGATSDPVQVRRDFDKFKGALVGIATLESKLLVLDLDDKNGVNGVEWLSAEIKKHGEWPDTVEGLSPSGGWHVFFQYPDFDPKTCAGEVAPGVDVRGHGGMIIAPPSVKPGGTKGYVWKNAPGVYEVAPAPQWLLDQLPHYNDRPKTPARPANVPPAPPSPAYGEATLRGEIERLKAAPQGTRNAALNNAALKLGQLVPDGHLSESLIVERLTEAAAVIGLDAVETGATIKSGMSKGMTEPRGPGGDALARLGTGPGDYVPAGMLLEPVQVVHRTAPAFTFTAVGDLEARPPEFLIDGLIETDTLGVVFGDPGCGKSFIAADIALSVATGEPFHGRPTKQGAVFFIAGEGHSGLARRFHAWARHRGRGLAGVPMFKSNKAAQFLDAASAQAVADAVDALVSAHGVPHMIIVDTLARNFGPGDENSTSEMGAFVAAMDDLRGRHPGCVVLIVHHSGHGDKLRARGSMALKGAIEFEYRAEKSDDTITLTNIKMKDAPLAAPMAFRLQGVPLADGASSAAMVPTVAPEGRGKLKPNEKVALKAFKAAADEQDGWDNGLHLIQWSDAFLKIHTGTNPDSKRRMFDKVRAELVEKGIVSVEHDIYKINGSLPLNSDGLPDFSGFVRTNPAVQGGLSGLPPIGESRIRHSGPHMPGIN